jgi:hypothetical protein
VNWHAACLSRCRRGDPPIANVGLGLGSRRAAAWGKTLVETLILLAVLPQALWIPSVVVGPGSLLERLGWR